MTDIPFHEVNETIKRACKETGKTYEEIKEDIVWYTGIHIRKFKEYPYGIVVNPTNEHWKVIGPVGNFYFEPVICQELFILWDDSIKVEAFI